MSGDPEDTQPLAQRRKRVRRQYIHAEWAESGAWVGSPKISGGVTIDNHGNIIQARAFNRPDQRYELPEAELDARRQARALAERAGSVVLAGAGSLIEFRAVSGNNYDLLADGTGCDCPDQLRLNESGKTNVLCKHSLISIAVLSDVGGFVGLDWSTSRLAEVIGIDERTAEHLCQIGFVIATKVHNVWVIPIGTPTDEAVAEYQAKIIGDMPELPFIEIDPA